MISIFEVKISFHDSDHINKNYVFETNKNDESSEDLPYILKKNYSELQGTFKSIVDMCKEVTFYEADRIVVSYQDPKGQGYLVGKHLKTVEVEKADDIAVSVNESNVIKIKRIAAGLKTVMEFVPVNKQK